MASGQHRGGKTDGWRRFPDPFVPADVAWRLKRALITASCHDDLTASDLVGRFLVKLAHMTRNLKGQGFNEGASPRLLVHAAAKLIVSGVVSVTACRSAIAQALTDDADMLAAVYEFSASLF